MRLLDSAAPGEFARGSVGAGTAMNAFGFRAGIGSASRVLPSDAGGYRVGVLVNDNTGSSRRQLTILGVPVGERLRERIPAHLSEARSALKGTARRAEASSSSSRPTRRSMAASCAPSRCARRWAWREPVSRRRSAAAISSLRSRRRASSSASPTSPSQAPKQPIVEDDDALDALYTATAEATQAAIYDALFEAKTMTGTERRYGLRAARRPSDGDAARRARDRRYS